MLIKVEKSHKGTNIAKEIGEIFLVTSVSATMML
jgi:hypothetical protein